MKNFKNIIIYLFILIPLVSCASLPQPKIAEGDKKKKKIDIKQMVTGVENSNTDKSQSEPKSSIEELILKSIKKD